MKSARLKNALNLTPLIPQKPKLYVLQGGDSGASRLKLLNIAYWPTSQAILLQAGLKPGMKYLDVGCGAGDTLIRVSQLLKQSRSLVGIDNDPSVLKIAKRVTDENSISAQFHLKDILSNDGFGLSDFDFVYSRSVLTHLKKPETALKNMLDATKKGGTILVEDIEFTGSFSFPYCPAYYRFTELYQKTVRSRGADPNIGPKLFNMFQDLGISDLHLSVTQPTFFQGEGKQIAHITLQHIKDAVVAAQLADPQEVDQVVETIRSFAENPRTLLSFPRVFQVWGRKL